MYSFLGYQIQAHFGGVMKSQKNWGSDALDFKPERFLKNDQLIRDERVIPFSVGKRQCPGETLARAEIFLYLTTLLQKLSFSVGKKYQSFVRKRALVKYHSLIVQ